MFTLWTVSAWMRFLTWALSATMFVVERVVLMMFSALRFHWFRKSAYSGVLAAAASIISAAWVAAVGSADVSAVAETRSSAVEVSAAAGLPPRSLRVELESASQVAFPASPAVLFNSEVMVLAKTETVNASKEHPLPESLSPQLRLIAEYLPRIRP